MEKDYTNRSGFYTAFLPENEIDQMDYSELQITTNFTFLRGGSHPGEIVNQAAALGYKAIAITDHNNVAGIVRAHVAAKTAGIRMITGCRLNLLDGPSLLAYPTDTKSYSRLTNLLTDGNFRTEKGSCHLYKEDVYKYAKDIKFIAVPPTSLNPQFDFELDFYKALKEYKHVLGNNLYIGVSFGYRGDDAKKMFLLSEFGNYLGSPLVATNDVHYHHPENRELQDIVTCIREKCTIYDAGYKLHPNSERYLKPPAEIIRLFRQYPDAIRRTQEIAEACQFSLDSLKYVYPDEDTGDGLSRQEKLEQLTWEKAKQYYGENLPGIIMQSVPRELQFIKERNWADYFLTVYDFVKTANELGILCQGRGSAANSSVCFCLGITSVDPTKFDLLFDRFMSAARDEPPDIDVDFEHERREEIIQYIYKKYGRRRAAIVATVTQVHQKGAVRDVARAMGMSTDAIDRLSKSVWELTDEWFEGKKIAEQGFNPQDAHLRKILQLTHQYMGFPRQLGQHTGGFVMTQENLSDLCPIHNARMENRTCIEWNKDDIDALGIIKVDVLALGMLTCIRKAFALTRTHYQKEFTLADIPQDDPAVYDMVTAADTIGVFQIESRAQMSMLPRLKPRCFYDLVIEVAIVRPGPIQGDMVHPYLRRRNGQEPIEYPSQELKDILGKTLGVPLFQEQAMRIAMVAAGFTGTEADQLRKSMATFKAKGLVSAFEKKLIDGMTARGYKKEYAERVFRQLEGFGSYGFPESHAASFASLVYVSCYLKCYYPDVFATALLNSLPMGFYAPAQIVRDAIKHGVELRPIDINHSDWDYKLEEKSGHYFSIRIGFRQIEGIHEEDIAILVSNRKQQYTAIHQLLDIGVTQSGIELLADADAFGSLGYDRRKALWEASSLKDRPIGLFAGLPSESTYEQVIQLPKMSAAEQVIYDRLATTLSIKGNLISHVRKELDYFKVTRTKDLVEYKDGTILRVAGEVLVKQRPGTAGGVCFITIEDDTGIANLIAFKQVFEEKYRSEILNARLLMIEGKLQIEGQVVHIVIRKCWNMNYLLKDLVTISDDGREAIPVTDEKVVRKPISTNKKTQVRTVVQGEIFPSGRNFK